MQNQILLVEDNEDDVRLAMRALKKANVNAVFSVVRDGREALDFLFAQGKYAGRNPHELPIVVFLDIKMPLMNGLEVLAYLRGQEVTRYLPVVMLTTSSEASDLIQSYHLGANSYVRKQANFVEFSGTIVEMTRYWSDLNASALHNARH
ncbi:MAG: response regulator [Anaerolineae bacterium]|nr:response regulator [Anaerolineae bacterium]